MKLMELIDFFKKGNSFETFCKQQGLNSSSEVIEVYMEKPFHLDANLYFFEIEKTEGQYEFIVNNKKLYNLFDFYYFIDFIKELNEKGINDNKSSAKTLLNYSLRDK